MSNDKNLHVINLGAEEAPEIIETPSKDYVLYSDNNSYYDYLIDMYKSSATNNAVINNISRLLYGGGVKSLRADKKPGEYAQFKTIFENDCIKKFCFDYKLLGQAAFQVHYTKDHKRIKRVFHIPVNLLAPEKCNEETGNIEGYYFSNDWNNTRKYAPVRYSAFGYSDDEIEILVLKNYCVGLKYFGAPDYIAGLPYAYMEKELSAYLCNEIDNSFSGTKIINFSAGIPTPSEQDIITSKVKEKLTGARGEKIIISFNHDENSKTTVEDVSLTDGPDHYSYVNELAQSRILVSHNITSPLIFGISSNNNGFSSNADELKDSMTLFDNMIIKPAQNSILEVIERILAFNNIVGLKLYFKTLQPLEFIDVEKITDKDVKEEETGYKMSKEGLTELDEIINGAESKDDLINMGWHLVDDREANPDNEDILNEHLEKIETKLNEKSTLLNKVINLVKTGRAFPNAKSKQDALIEKSNYTKYFKVRYEYFGNKNPQRAFCKAMIRANKVYRVEDIERMNNSSTINPGFGPQGSRNRYDIFKYKGGPRCKHAFRRLTFAVDYDNLEAGFKKIGTKDASILGFKVINPEEVRIFPNNMPLKGYNPSNQNLPKDV